MNLGQFIKQQRLKKGYTMEQLAKIIGKNKAFISRIENNKVKTLKNDSIEPLANALDVPVIALFEGFDVDGNKTEQKQMTPIEFAREVRILLARTKLSEQKKELLLSTLNFICSEN